MSDISDMIIAGVTTQLLLEAICFLNKLLMKLLLLK